MGRTIEGNSRKKKKKTAHCYSCLSARPSSCRQDKQKSRWKRRCLTGLYVHTTMFVFILLRRDTAQKDSADGRPEENERENERSQMGHRAHFLARAIRRSITQVEPVCPSLSLPTHTSVHTHTPTYAVLICLPAWRFITVSFLLHCPLR